MFKNASLGFLLGCVVTIIAFPTQDVDPASGPFVASALRVADQGERQMEDMRSIMTILQAVTEPLPPLALRDLRSVVVSNVDHLESETLNTAMLFFATLEHEIYESISTGQLTMSSEYDGHELATEILAELNAR